MLKHNISNLFRSKYPQFASLGGKAGCFCFCAHFFFFSSLTVANLFSLCRRITNIYFLVIVIISFIPAISPFSGVTSLLPLVFVLGVSAIKDGFEDYVRPRMKIDRKQLLNRIFLKLYPQIHPRNTAETILFSAHCSAASFPIAK
jgi:hypothetical protein